MGQGACHSRVYTVLTKILDGPSEAQSWTQTCLVDIWIARVDADVSYFFHWFCKLHLYMHRMLSFNLSTIYKLLCCSLGTWRSLEGRLHGASTVGPTAML